MNRGMVWCELTQDVDWRRDFKKTMENGLFIDVRSNYRRRLNFEQNFFSVCWKCQEEDSG